MSIAKAAAKNPIQFAIAGALIVGVLYFTGRKILGDVAGAAGGVVSGNNALTAGTAYAGDGIAGTLGAAADRASGGTLSDVGSWLGGKVYDWTHAEYNPNDGKTGAAQIVQQGADATDTLWGRIGNVLLRAN